MIKLIFLIGMVIQLNGIVLANELSGGFLTGTKDTHTISTFNGMNASLTMGISKEYAISAKMVSQLDYFSYYEKMKYSNDLEFKVRLAKKTLNEYPTNIIVGTGVGAKVNESNSLEYYSKFRVGVSFEKEYKKLLFELTTFSKLSDFDVGLGFNTKIAIDPKYSVNFGLQKTFNSEDIFAVNVGYKFE
jgi:hypothetical protein